MRMGAGGAENNEPWGRGVSKSWTADGAFCRSEYKEGPPELMVK